MVSTVDTLTLSTHLTSYLICWKKSQFTSRLSCLTSFLSTPAWMPPTCRLPVVYKRLIASRASSAMDRGRRIAMVILNKKWVYLPRVEFWRRVLKISEHAQVPEALNAFARNNPSNWSSPYISTQHLAALLSLIVWAHLVGILFWIWRIRSDRTYLRQLSTIILLS